MTLGLIRPPYTSYWMRQILNKATKYDDKHWDIFGIKTFIKHVFTPKYQ